MKKKNKLTSSIAISHRLRISEQMAHPSELIAVYQRVGIESRLRIANSVSHLSRRSLHYRIKKTHHPKREKERRLQISLKKECIALCSEYQSVTKTRPLCNYNSELITLYEHHLRILHVTRSPLSHPLPISKLSVILQKAWLILVSLSLAF